MTARSRTQPKPSQKLHEWRILEKVDLACRCCQSETLTPSVIVNPEYQLMEHKTLANKNQREAPGERKRRANTQAQRSAGGGAENPNLRAAAADHISEEEISSENCVKKIAVVSERRGQKKWP